MADDASLNSAPCTCLVVRSRDGFPLEAPWSVCTWLCQALISGNCPPKTGEWDAHRVLERATQLQTSGKRAG